MELPQARGPLSAGLFGGVRDPEQLHPDVLVEQVRQLLPGSDPLTHDDLQLCLWVLYELHYRGFARVDDAAEWDPELLRVRRVLEHFFEDELRRRTRETVAAAIAGEGDVATRLFAFCESFASPSVAQFVQREATLEQVNEFLVQRSIYHLKEFDPTSWSIPRLTGGPKVALAEVQYDEYGAGRPERLHSQMFADALEACGLDSRYGTYIDQVPATTLAVNNAMNMFGLHRRLQPAALGHFGAFEATSSLPSRRFVAGMRRLGLPEPAPAYFDEHVEADAVHEQIALRDVCAGVAAEGPAALHDVFFGAAVCLYLGSVTATESLDCWRHGRSALRQPADGAAVA